MTKLNVTLIKDVITALEPVVQKHNIDLDNPTLNKHFRAFCADMWKTMIDNEQYEDIIQFLDEFGDLFPSEKDNINSLRTTVALIKELQKLQ